MGDTVTSDYQPHIRRCGHLAGTAVIPLHGHLIQIAPNEEHLLCDACYERLLAVLMPEEEKGRVLFYGDPPLTEPDPSWAKRFSAAFRRQNPY